VTGGVNQAFDHGHDITHQSECGEGLFHVLPAIGDLKQNLYSVKSSTIAE
jgi:hypothetical protein